VRRFNEVARPGITRVSLGLFFVAALCLLRQAQPRLGHCQ
jgi:hypothetical protein